MNQDTRILIAFTVSFLALLAWRAFVFKEPPAPPKTAPSSPARPTPGQQPVEAPPATPSEVSLPILQGRKAEEIVIEGDLYRVTLSTQGAVVKSWILKKYRDENEKPLDVVNGEACEKLGFPMSVNLPDQTLTNKLATAVYVAQVAKLVAGREEGGLSGSPFAAPVNVALTYSDGTIQVAKKFSFGSGYEVHVEVSVSDSRGNKPVKVAWPDGFGDHSLPVAVREASTQVVYGTPEKISTVAQKKLKEDLLLPAPLVLAGAEDRYFTSIFLPDSPDQAAFHVGRRDWTPADWKEKDPQKPLVAVLGSAQPKPLAFRLFVGPKDLDILRSVKPPLDGLLDFGWFSLVAKPLFLILRSIYDHAVHNYGWAIIILTVIINLAMFPLKMKQIRSAQEMQRVAPIIKSIQDRYKQYKFNDPRKQRMNEEVMKVYHEHGINPLGGCLPMVIQLPFLYAFYNVLSQSIELRHAPWILWVRDLSSPDRFHLFGFPVPILLTVMIITMFVLQKMTPVATPDPAQQRMMMIMPLFFGAMFYNVASGLVLYWLTSNVVGIAQQVFINRVMPGGKLGPALSPPPRAP